MTSTGGFTTEETEFQGDELEDVSVKDIAKTKRKVYLRGRDKMTRHCFVVFEVGGASYKEFTVPFTSDPPVGVFVALPVNSAAYTVQDLVSLKG